MESSGAILSRFCASGCQEKQAKTTRIEIRRLSRVTLKHRAKLNKKKSWGIEDHLLNFLASHSQMLDLL